MLTATDLHGCVITWNGRRNSMVTMENKLFLHDQRIPLTIRIHRHLLTLFVEPEEKEAARIAQAQGRTPLDCLTLQIASVIKQISEAKPRSGRTEISRPLAPPPLGGRVSVTRDAWTILSKLPPETFAETRREAISSQINVLFFFGGGLRRVLHPARGRWAGTKVLGDYLPDAYFACRELVLLSEEWPKLKELIAICLGQLEASDPNAQCFLAKTQPSSYRKQIQIMCLVYRAFKGAWETYGLDGLPEPQQAFRRYLYGRRPVRDLYRKLRQLDKHLYLEVVEKDWIGCYLSEPGAAARRYKLL